MKTPSKELPLHVDLRDDEDSNHSHSYRRKHGLFRKNGPFSKKPEEKNTIASLGKRGEK